MKPDLSVYDALRASKLATELADDQCRALADVMTARSLGDGEALVREGTADDHLHVLVSGVLAVVRGAGTDNETTLFTLTPGDLVGELSFLDGTVHYASVVARGRAQVISLGRDRLETLLVAHALVVYRVMRSIVRTVHELQRRLSAQAVELSNYIYKQHGRY